MPLMQIITTSVRHEQVKQALDPRWRPLRNVATGFTRASPRFSNTNQFDDNSTTCQCDPRLLNSERCHQISEVVEQ